MADPSQFAYRSPGAANAYGPVNDNPDWDQSLPEQTRMARGLSPSEQQRYHSAARAHLGAVENQIDAVGNPNRYSRVSDPDEAVANYPAW